MQVFSCEFYGFFQKTLFTEHHQRTAPADSSVTTNVLFIYHTCFFQRFILLLLIIAVMRVNADISSGPFFYFDQKN